MAMITMQLCMQKIWMSIHVVELRLAKGNVGSGNHVVPKSGGEENGDGPKNSFDDKQMTWRSLFGTLTTSDTGIKLKYIPPTVENDRKLA